MNFLALVAIILFLFAVYSIGGLLCVVLPKKNGEEVFYATFKNLFIGTLTIVLVTSVVRTAGNTIMLGLLLVALLYLLSDKPKVSFSPPRFSKEKILPLVIALIVASIYFFIQGSFLYDNSNDRIASVDFYYYAHDIHNMWYNGVECFSAAWEEDIKALEPSPYHYIELWLAALFYGMFGFGVIESQVVIVHSILVTICTVGMMALARAISTNVIILVLAVFSVYIMGIKTFDAFYVISMVADSVSAPKLSIITCVYIWAVILMIKKDHHFIYPFLLLPITNIALAPPIGISVFILGFLIFVIKKDRQSGLSIMSKIFIVEIFIAIFYFIQSNSGTTHRILGIDILLEGHSFYGNPIKDVLYTIFWIPGTFSGMLPYVIVTLLFIIFDKKKVFWEMMKSQTLLVGFLILTLLSAYAVVAVLSPMSESFQFVMLFDPLYNTIIAALLLWQFSVITNRVFKYVYLFIIIGFISFSLYKLPKSLFYQYTNMESKWSKEYMTTVKYYIEKDSLDISPIAVLTDVSQGNYWHWKWVSYLEFLNTQSITHAEVSIHDVFIDTMKCSNNECLRAKQDFSSRPFYEYVYERNPKYTYDEIPQYQLDYVKEKQIKYLLLQGAELPSVFKSCVDTIIVNTVKPSEKFFVLKY